MTRSCHPKLVIYGLMYLTYYVFGQFAFPEAQTHLCTGTHKNFYFSLKVLTLMCQKSLHIFKNFHIMVSPST